MCARAGCDAIGLNFAAASPRYITAAAARSLVMALREETESRVEVVGVFVNSAQDEVLELAEHVGLDSIQLHGEESVEQLASYLAAGTAAFKAERIASAEDARRAGAYPGERILVDAKVSGARGGTGHTFDWGLIRELNEQRDLILAGGLRADNVAQAVREVRPFGVDTASGVELSPGKKDPELVRSFVERAKTTGV